MNGATFVEASPTKMLPVADPCPEIAGCAYLTANPPPITGCVPYQENGLNATVNPGCYSSFQLNGGSVHMNPGLYVFTGIIQDNGPPVSGSGVMIYVANGGGPAQFNGGNVTLSPPTTGNYAGVLYYQAPSNTNVVQFNGGSMNLSGLIYAPGSLGQVNGTGGSYVVLVLGTAQLNGGFTVDAGSPTPGQTLIKNAVLVQ